MPLGLRELEVKEDGGERYILLRASSALLCPDFRSRGSSNEAHMTQLHVRSGWSITSDIHTTGAVDIAECKKKRETFYVQTNY